MISFTIVKYTPSMELPKMIEIKLKNDDEEAVIENFLDYRITFEKIKGEINGKNDSN